MQQEREGNLYERATFSHNWGAVPGDEEANGKKSKLGRSV